jgi:integrase
MDKMRDPKSRAFPAKTAGFQGKKNGEGEIRTPEWFSPLPVFEARQNLHFSREFSSSSRIQSCYHLQYSTGMPRQPKLGKKKGYWHTQAGSRNGVYFGRVDEVPFKEARDLFNAHVQAISKKGSVRPGSASTTDLVNQFLDFLRDNRSDRTLGERRLHLTRFLHLRIGTRVMALIPATSVTHDDLLAFTSHISQFELSDKTPGHWVKRDDPLDPFTVGKHQTSVIACFAWGAGRRNPMPCLPRDFNPFHGANRYKRPPEPLLESELPTQKEIQALLDHADDDQESVRDKSGYRTRRPDEYRTGDANPYKGFKDMLTVYHHTGARTSELADARVEHFVRSAKQIVLGKHKRAKTMRDPKARRIMLDGESFEIVDALCKGKAADEPIFTDQKGRAWTRIRLGTRFQQVRYHAKVRDAITIYSFRHLWISDALVDNPIATVANMAGTSVEMIERVYGHFRSEHLSEVQEKMLNVRRERRHATAS